MITTLIFDLDGLLIQSEIVAYELYNVLLGEYGKRFTLEDYAANYSGKTAIGNMKTIIERFQLPITTQEGLNFIHIREQEYIDRGIPLHSGVKELLHYLQEHHYHIVLGTSSTRERALKTLKLQGIDGYFEAMAFGPEVKNGKPEPDIFLKAVEKSKQPAENCLVLEDSENGILAASRAGVRVACIPDLKQPHEQFAALSVGVFDSLLDIIDYLEKENQ